MRGSKRDNDGEKSKCPKRNNVCNFAMMWKIQSMCKESLIFFEVQKEGQIKEEASKFKKNWDNKQGIIYSIQYAVNIYSKFLSGLINW